MAILIVTLLALGLSMKSNQWYDYYALHKSLGVLAILAIFLRLIWRMLYPWESSTKGSKREKIVKWAHRCLLGLLTLMPMAGMLASGFGGHGIALFSLQLIPSNYDEKGQAMPFDVTLMDFGYQAHEIIGYLIITLLSLHIVAALKHHFLDKDNTLKRMLGIQ
ncbi:cytochrome b561 [Arenicella xantha]|uniref:Cytochrome b561 n=1 Tax=Arenicella xantha TaxID=644221 RepID=A0A395JJ53_9GAMM|nr:cytochrome b561 [Arenicella xantha]